MSIDGRKLSDIVKSIIDKISNPTFKQSVSEDEYNEIMVTFRDEMQYYERQKLLERIRDFLKLNNIKESSADVYSYYYVKIIIDCFINEPENMFNKQSIDKLIDYVNKTELNNKVCFLISWRKLGELKGDKGNISRINEMIKTLNQYNLYREPSSKELDNRIDLDELIKYREYYKNWLLDYFTKYDIYYLLCCLYTYEYPLRSEDYYNTIIDDGLNYVDIDIDNYYDPIKHHLVINHYKTSKVYGRRVILICDDLHNIIMNFHHKSSSKYLICSSTGNQLNHTTFCHVFNRCLDNKNISSSMIRKCIISDKIDEGMTAKERITASKIMGHSLNTQQMIYSRFSDILHPNNDENYIDRRRKRLLNELERLDNMNLAKI